MNTQIRFSIITISFNAEKVIGRTIESVLNQNFENMEYIFVDGGSTDNTNKVIKGYAEQLNRRGISVKHISEQDKGISDAFNKGIKLSDGNIIIILNADDELCPGALRCIDEKMTDEVDILYGNCVWKNDKENISYIRKANPDPSGLIHAMQLIHPSTFVRKKMYDQYGVFRVDYKFCMDRELLVRMLRGGARFKYINFEFTIMKAGGVSDKNFWGVLREGNQIPRMYGEPEWKILFYTLKKYGKHKLSRVYRRIKNNTR